LVLGGLFLSGIAGLLTGIVVVLGIFPRIKPTPIYQLILYGLIPVLFTGIFLIAYSVINNLNFW
jgi:hypothetical protein